MSPEEIHLWDVPLRVSDTALIRAHGVLSVAERQRLLTVLDSPRADRLAIARAALRAVLGRYLGIEPGHVPLSRTPAGKPVLAGDGEQLAFSVSHSGELAVIAVTGRETVGVDIERLGRPERVEGLLDRVLTPGEASVVRARPKAERERALLLDWTAKEAYLKALGTGWDRDPRGLSVVSAAALLTLGRFNPGPGMVGSVAAAGGPWRAVARSLGRDYLG